MPAAPASVGDARPRRSPGAPAAAARRPSARQGGRRQAADGRNHALHRGRRETIGSPVVMMRRAAAGGRQVRAGDAAGARWLDRADESVAGVRRRSNRRCVFGEQVDVDRLGHVRSYPAASTSASKPFIALAVSATMGVVTPRRAVRGGAEAVQHRHLHVPSGSGRRSEPAPCRAPPAFLGLPRPWPSSASTSDTSSRFSAPSSTTSARAGHAPAYLVAPVRRAASASTCAESGGARRQVAGGEGDGETLPSPGCWRRRCRRPWRARSRG